MDTMNKTKSTVIIDDWLMITNFSFIDFREETRQTYLQQYNVNVNNNVTLCGVMAEWIERRPRDQKERGSDPDWLKILWYPKFRETTFRFQEVLT